MAGPKCAELTRPQDAAGRLQTGREMVTWDLELLCSNTWATQVTR
jgi:hypothetical protein